MNLLRRWLEEVLVPPHSAKQQVFRPATLQVGGGGKSLVSLSFSQPSLFLFCCFILSRASDNQKLAYFTVL